MTPRPISVLLVGDAERAEFAAIFQWLREHGETTVAPDFAAAMQELEARDGDPELIVLAQSWPGQFSPKQIERLRRLAPLARVDELLGSWCEGETRTGRPPGGTLAETIGINGCRAWRRSSNGPRVASGRSGAFRRPRRKTNGYWQAPSEAEASFVADSDNADARSDRHLAAKCRDGSNRLCDVIFRAGLCEYLAAGRAGHLFGRRASRDLGRAAGRRKLGRRIGERPSGSEGRADYRPGQFSADRRCRTASCRRRRRSRLEAVLVGRSVLARSNNSD